MPERPSALELTQIGAETTPGTAVAAAKRLLCTDIKANPVVPITPFRPRGSKYHTQVIRHKEMTEAQLQGVLSYNDLVYLASGVLCAPAITTPAGATNTRLWTFKPNVYSADTVQTFTVQTGDAYYAEQFAYALINALTIRVNKSEASVQGSLFGQALAENSTLSTCEVQTINLGGATGGTFSFTFGGQTTAALAYNITAAALQTAIQGLSSVGAGNAIVALVSAGIYTVTYTGALAMAGQALATASFASLVGATGPAITRTTPGLAPTLITELPVDTDNVQIQVGNSVGSLAKISRCLEVELQIGNRYGHIETLDDGTTSFSAHVERGPDFSGHVVVQHDSTAQGYMADLRTKNEKFLRILATGPVIEGAFNYKIQITVPFKFKDDKRADKDDILGSTFEIIPIYDVTLGSAIEILVWNTLTAL